MEHYWCLRWIAQEKVMQIDATVLRENLVRFDGLPLAIRVPSLPELDAGTRVRLSLAPPDLIGRTMACGWQETLTPASSEQKPP